MPPACFMQNTVRGHKGKPNKNGQWDVLQVPSTGTTVRHRRPVTGSAVQMQASLLGIVTRTGVGFLAAWLQDLQWKPNRRVDGCIKLTNIGAGGGSSSVKVVEEMLLAALRG